jgi:ribosomal protein RSM22 (predicted rRNA methylase)
VDLPRPLVEALDRAVEGVERAELGRLVGELRDGYRAGGVHVTPDTTPAALAYAVYRMPGTYAALHSVLAEVRARAAIPGRVVDVGGGTGAGAWAVATIFPDVTEMTVVDRSVPALDLGRDLAEGQPWSGRVRWVASPARDVPPADLALASYLLGELSETEREGLVGAMVEAAATVLVVEPGTTAGYGRILRARSALIEAGLSVAAPCPHDAPCPMAEADWCHFAARFGRPPLLRQLKGAAHGHEDEKFSYVVATSHPARPAPGRIVRHPAKRQKGLVRLEVCAPDVAIRPVTITRRSPDYRLARDTRWGDPWPPTGGFL